MKEHIACKPALAVLAVISWIGVLLQVWLSLNLAFANGKTVFDGFVTLFRYFTVLTNLFVALTATLPLTAGFSRLGSWFGRPMVRGCATTSIIMVGLPYHFLLRNIWQPHGLQLFADVVLHYVVPISFLAYWSVFPPRSKFGILSPFAWCIYPLGYCVYVFVRGEMLGTYPYYFIDATSLGYGRAMLNSFGFFIAFICLGYAVLAVATFRKRLPNS